MLHGSKPVAECECQEFHSSNGADAEAPHQACTTLIKKSHAVFLQGRAWGQFTPGVHSLASCLARTSQFLGQSL